MGTPPPPPHARRPSVSVPSSRPPPRTSAAQACRGSGPSYGIGIPCRNEAQNVGRLLRELIAAAPAAGGPKRIVVVSDESTDGTDELVGALAERAPLPIVLVSGARRRGKPAAVNRIIAELADVEVIVLVSADVLPAPGCIERLVAAVAPADVGVAGGRPVPEGPEHKLAVRVTRLLWELHHWVALRHPKSTEITAFRNLGHPIDESTLVDEAEIEWALTQAGLRVVYVPEAVVHTPSPLTMADYLRQRVRVTVGHLRLATTRGYRVRTLDLRERLAALGRARQAGHAPAATVVAAVALEAVVYAVAVGLGRLGPDRPRGWARIRSTKRPLDPER